MPTGFVVMLVLVVTIFVVAFGVAIVRSCGDCSSSDSKRRPPAARVVMTPSVSNLYPNHVLDIHSQSAYVPTPQYQPDNIPLAVAIPMVPTAPSASSYPSPIATRQFYAVRKFEGASRR